MIVAEITKDHIFDPLDDADTDATGKQFDYNAMLKWWGWDDLPNEPGWLEGFEKTAFKLYDDDNELYYEGWLLNDHLATVQQFVLSWAKGFAGCTTIKIYSDDVKCWTQEIG